MWTITGPFGALGEGPDVTKLLKPGKEYILGRKDKDLNVDLRAISHEHCSFEVGPFTQENVVDPSFVPTIKVFNKVKKDKAMKQIRGEAVVSVVNKQGEAFLEDGDAIAITSTKQVTVKWEPVCCYTPLRPKPTTVILESCAKLGIHIACTPSDLITHHITPFLEPTLDMTISLIKKCTFVRPEWQQELIRIGELKKEDDGTSLEEVFALPSVKLYLPNFKTSVPPLFRDHDVWSPNAKRSTMFSKLKVVYVGADVRGVNAEVVSIFAKGGGGYECVQLNSGLATFSTTLAKCHRAGITQEPVLVADEDQNKSDVGADAWKQFVTKAQSFGLSFISLQDIIECVLSADSSRLTKSTNTSQSQEQEQEQSQDNMDIDAAGSSSLPDYVPNTHPDEPSQFESQPLKKPEVPSSQVEEQSRPAPPPRRVLPPRRTRALSKEHSPAPDDDGPAPLRRKLPPRGQNMITGIDDPSVSLSSMPDTSMNSEQTQTPASRPYLNGLEDIPIAPRKKTLRKRTGMAQPSPAKRSISQALEDDDDASSIPASKRPKIYAEEFETALFEQPSAPPESEMAGMEDQSQNEIQSQLLHPSVTQSGIPSQSGSSLTSKTALEALREEEEEETQSGAVASSGTMSSGGSTSHGNAATQGTKRKATDDVVEGVAAAKKRAVENVNSIQRAPPPAARSLKSSGAAPGKPDTDADFLKAVASTKRGKKTEDIHDREFNKLKIHKPNLQAEEAEKDWALLANFGDDADVRGNFMVIVEMEPFQKNNRSLNVVPPAWDEKPNFKKFKKKKVAGERATVDLVATNENDYDVGSNYWEKRQRQKEKSKQHDEQAGSPQALHSDDDNFQTQASMPRKETSKRSQPVRKGTRTLVVDSDEDEAGSEDVEVVPATRGKGKSKAPSSRASSIAASTTTRRGTRATSALSQKTQALFLDDSDDDEVKIIEQDEDVDMDDGTNTMQSSLGSSRVAAPTRKSSRGATTAKGKRAAPIVIDDDSDGGAFVRKKTRR